MAPRPLLATLLLATAVALAGCTSDAPAPAPPKDDAPDAPAAAPPAREPAAAPPVPQTRPANPDPTMDDGDIRGAFDKSWDIEAPRVGARGLTVLFNLTGVEAGAPPTATVTLRLVDPDGAPVRTATLGVGGDGNALAWTLQGTEMMAGTYTLTAQAPAPGPGSLPSAGLAQYDLYAYAEY